MLGPQAVDERVDEGREFMAGWENVRGDKRVLDTEFGGPVYSFVATNAAISRSPDQGYIAVGGFRLSISMWIHWTRGCEELTLWIAKRAASESEVMRKF